MVDVLQELETMFNRAIEDVSKAQLLKPTMCTVFDAANRYIKLSRRFYDIYKLFIEEYRETIDVIAARCMLLFVRACFIMSAFVFETPWTNRKNVRRTISRMGSAPKRAAHKIIKRTLRKKDYEYHNPEEDYERHGFKKHFSFDNERKPQDELIRVGLGLKETGSRLLYVFDHAGLIDPKATLASIGRTIPPADTYDVESAKKDLVKCSQTLKSYYIAVLEELIADTRADSSANHDLCILPLMESLGMEPRQTLRGFTNEEEVKPMMLDVRERNDIVEVTTRIYLLDLAPIG